MSAATKPLKVSPFGRGPGPVNFPVGRLPGGRVNISFVPPVTIGGRGVVPRAQLLPSRVDPQQVNVAGIGSPISLVYGRNRIAGKVMQPIFWQLGQRLLVPIMLGSGEFDALESVEMDGRPVPATVVSTFYAGRPVQTVDTFLQAAWAIQGKTYADTLPNIAWVNVAIPNDQNISFENIAFIVRGQKLYDPRDGTQLLADPTTWKYSDNPALALAHFLSAPDIGPEDTLDWTSVTAMANVNDQIVGAGAQAEKRRRIGIVFDQTQDVDQIEQTLRAHAGCWVVRENGITRLVADAPSTSVFHFTKGKYRSESLEIKVRGRGAAPTVVTVQYTDVTSSPWKTMDCPTSSYAAGVIAGTTPWIESVVQMPGIQSPGQALREQIRRLNEFTLCDMDVTFIALDEGARVMVGDVFELTDAEGFAQKPFRCTDAYPVEPGRWQIKGSEYQAGVYSDAVMADPDIPDTSLPDLRNIVAPSNLVASAETFFERLGGGSGSLATGFIYQCRGNATVTPPVYAYPFGYRWELFDGAVKIDDQITDQPSYTTPIVQQGKTYTINCYARSLYGPESATPATGSFFAQGKVTPPNPVKAVTYAQEIGGDVHVIINPPDDQDVIRFEWRYTPNQTVGGSWAAALLINRVDSYAATFPGLPVGTHRLYVASIDAAGNPSTTFATADVTVTLDTDAVIQSHDFAPAASGGLTNMIAYPPLEGVWTDRWITSVPGTTFNAGITGTVNAVATPIVQIHTNGTSKFVGEAWDLGQVVSAVWTLFALTTPINGVTNFSIETSLDGTSYSPQPGLSVKADARFVRPVISADNGDTFRIDAKPRIQLAALSKPENFDVTTLASGGKLVAFVNQYSGLTKKQITAINTSAARQTSLDRLMVYPQSGLMLTFTEAGATAGSGNGGGAGDGFVIQEIASLSRVIASGDFLEYDVWIDPFCPTPVDFSVGSILLHYVGIGFSNGLSAITDQNGYDHWTPAVGMDALARGHWYSRKIALTGTHVGMTCDSIRIGGHPHSNGTYKVLVRKVRFTNGAGTDLQAVWPPTLGGSIQSEPSSTAAVTSALTSNIRCGPANTCLAYAFNGSGTQVAQDVSISIEGI